VRTSRTRLGDEPRGFESHPLRIIHMILQENPPSVFKEVISKSATFVKEKAIQPVTNLLNKYERRILDSHWLVRAAGYSITFGGTALGVTGNLDWQTAKYIAAFNVAGMAYTWSTMAYFGANRESEVRRFVRFAKDSVKQVWNDPTEGIDAVKKGVLQEAEKLDGLMGFGLRRTLGVYGFFRRLPVLGRAMHIAREEIEKDVKGFHYYYDRISPYIPSDYRVEVPYYEFRGNAHWAYEIADWNKDDRKYRRVIVDQ
jgi:hypothetical protein